MKQRGRKSAARLTTVTSLPARLHEPPADLTTEQAAVWARIVATKPGDWWDAGSLPLLAQYCRAEVESVRVGEMVEAASRRLLESEDDVLGTYKELRKIQSALSGEMTSLATKMRLTQQSRYRADKADVSARKSSGRKPWQHHDVIDA